MPEERSAVWVSHSSIRDFLTCPRAYYLNNVYKDPKTGRKISRISPPLALGQVVHNVVESLSVLRTDERFEDPLMTKFNLAWKKVSGQKGGFSSEKEEEMFKKRGQDMIRRVLENPGPLKNLAIKIKQDLPHYWLSEDDNIILCGKIDWLEYLEDEESVHIIDFKTSKREEDNSSLQLPIYYLLATNCQNRPVKKASYWYLEFSDEPNEQKLPDMDEARDEILKIAKEVKLARQIERFKCPHGESGCFACRPLEAIIRGEATHVGVSEYNQDVYVLTGEESDTEEDSDIL